jgi:hypothetical protein
VERHFLLATNDSSHNCGSVGARLGVSKIKARCVVFENPNGTLEGKNAPYIVVEKPIIVNGFRTSESPAGI